MSERTVRIPAEALAQRLNRIEERLRALSLRTWPGAVRTAKTTVDITVTPTAAPAALVSVTAEPGRWVVFGHVQLAVNPIAATAYNLQVTLSATDASGATVTDNSGFDLRGRAALQTGLSAISAVYMPMTVIGHFTSEEIVTITLTANNYQYAAPDIPASVGVALDPFLAGDANLLLLPV